MNADVKKALAIGGALVIAGAAFGLGAYTMPRTIEVPKEVVKTVQVAGPVKVVEVPVEKIVERNVTVEKIVPVDNGNLGLVLDELVEKDGNVEYLTDGLDDDEVELIVDRLQLANEWEHIAYVEAKEKIIDDLHKENVSGIRLDKWDLRSLNIKVDEISFDEIDFETKDAEVLVPFLVRQDEHRFDGVARVVIMDGKVDDCTIDSIQLRN